MARIRNILLVICMLIVEGYTADCPDEYVENDGWCYYFSDKSVEVDWTTAESLCQIDGGHLVSIQTVEERTYIEDQLQKPVPLDSEWWIGLHDVTKEGYFEWSDGTGVVDDEVTNWKINEPNNIGVENCVEIWIRTPPSTYNTEWNDVTCGYKHPYVCKRAKGEIDQCPVEWTLINGRCYKLTSPKKEWFDADIICSEDGGTIVSFANKEEEDAVQNLITSLDEDVWIGLSDTVTPGTYTWNDPSTSFVYDNFQGDTSNPYTGSTCVVKSKDLGWKWAERKCSEEYVYMCERGVKADCPQGWTYLEPKCYEFVINENRVATWYDAKNACQSIGAGLIKIESEDEQKFISTALESYLNNGQREIWIGGTDSGHDNQLKWWDRTTISTYYWNTNMPTLQADKDDCISMYTGKGNDNWETFQCFTQLGYICEVPEGQDITLDTPTVEGKCDKDWRYYNGKCYFFGKTEKNKTDAANACRGFNAALTSVADSGEMSFIEGHLTQDSWIGYTCTTSDSCQWDDGETYTFNNWLEGEPSGSGSCVYTTVNAEWGDDDCGVLRYFVCKGDELPDGGDTPEVPTGDPDQEKCGGNGWFSDPQSDKCYQVNLQLRSWLDARSHCLLNGGEMVAISSPSEQTFVYEVIKELPSQVYLWTGGTDLNGFQLGYFVDQGWRWDDESPFNYINWATGEPNNWGHKEDCMAIQTSDGKWTDVKCELYFAFICEKAGNVDSIIGVDPSNEDCKSSEGCCLSHTGVEYGGVLPDSVLSASSEKDQWFYAARGRLSTPADVVIIDAENQIYAGTGHGAWEPRNDDPDPWLQVDYPTPMELKGIITQGRNGLLQIEEMQWTTNYKVSYSQDAEKAGGGWEWVSDSDGKPIIFDGNHDQNTMVTNFFPRAIVAKHIRCHPGDFFDARALRVEYIGCAATCFNNLGMNSGYITDEMITSSSNKEDAIQARAPAIEGECLTESDPKGEFYTGWISQTKNNRTCQDWNSQSPHAHDETANGNPNSTLIGNGCRNPEGAKDTPWCYTTDVQVEWEYCDIPTCPTYEPTGWIPDTDTTTEFVEVDFPDYFKVSGITIYKTPSYVKKYQLRFSEDGLQYDSYLDPYGNAKYFQGVDENVDKYLDILREPISTKYIRIYPFLWEGDKPQVQFEVNGCYVEERIGCGDTGLLWKDKESFSVACPSGCASVASPEPVYGTDIYTTHSSVCRAAIHAGKSSEEHGGFVTVTNREGLGQYEGSYRNGIQSTSFDAYTGSFLFDGLSYRCQDGWRSWGEHCYYFSPRGVQKSWTAAESDCQKMGANLVGINTIGENDYVESMLLQDDRGSTAWIGLNDIETPNYFLWIDGSPVTFTKWVIQEPDSMDDHCGLMYIANGFWDDHDCTELHPYICKRGKEYLPPATTSFPPTDDGCDKGWSAREASCYKVSTDVQTFLFADYHCETENSRLVSIHDNEEQIYVHQLVLTSLPQDLGYTAWIGLNVDTVQSGQQEYKWAGSEEEVTYTNWDEGEPDIKLECAFPFTYQGVEYTDCITEANPLVTLDYPWCSVDTEYNGRFIYCGTDQVAQGCTFMDDETGLWQIDYCLWQRHYVCERNRIGYTQPVVTTPTPDPQAECADGWYGKDGENVCYQINESDDRAERLDWHDALDFCRAQGADLVSIHSASEERTISQIIEDLGIYSYDSNYWIGLTSETANGDFEWTDGTPTDYTSWEYGQPDNYNGKEYCVEADYYYYYYGYTSWNDQLCDVLRNWICMISKSKTPLPPPTLPPPLGVAAPECGQDAEWFRFETEEGTNNCYLFELNGYLGWDPANEACIKKGGHLVSIHAEDENEFIRSRLVVTSIDNIWIGLRLLTTGEYQWADGTLMQYSNWNPGEPNNFYDSESCAEMYAGNGRWNDDNCGYKQGYICEKEIDADTNTIPPTDAQDGYCPEGFKPYGNNCYYFGDEIVTWTTAEEICGNMSDKIDLVSITNFYEQAFITSELYYLGSSAWIGLRSMFSDLYLWHDETQVTYTNWAAYEPDLTYSNEVCVKSIYFENEVGKWDDTYCSDYNKYICYTRKSPEYDAPDPTETPNECPSGYKKWDQDCYKVYNDPMSWDDAETVCQDDDKMSHLLTINHVYENNLITSWMWRDVSSSDKVWIGLQYDNDVQATFYWTSGWPLYYTNWDVGEPNALATAEGSGCVYFGSNGTWTVASSDGANTDQACTDTLPFICKHTATEPPTGGSGYDGTCPSGFVEYQNYCYLPVTVDYYDYTGTEKNKYEAKQQCGIHGATLASFHSQNEVNAVLGMLNLDPYGYYSNLWIGLQSDGNYGWKWDDGSPVDYLNWAYGEPNGQYTGEDCVEMYIANGLWNDSPCSNEKGYVCKKAKESKECSLVELVDREECGYIGVNEYACLDKGCCWDPLSANAYFTGCFHIPAEPTEVPVTLPIHNTEEVVDDGLSTIAIIGIVFAGLILLGVVIGGTIYCCKASSSSSFSATFSNSSKQQHMATSAGFSNPVQNLEGR